ncbi:hypothetical protein HOH45_06290 [bacterium]|nr:hypothetical protein [bacterium]
MQKIVIFLIAMTTLCFGQRFEDLALVKGFALGNALTAEKSLDAIFKNPSAPKTGDSPIFQTNVSSYYDSDIQILSFLYSTKLAEGVIFSIGIPVKKISGIRQTVELNGRAHEVGSFQDFHILGLSALTYSMETLSFGISAYVNHQTIGDYSANSFGFDVGFQAEINNLLVGASLQNLNKPSVEWSTGKSEEVSPIINGGLNIECSEKISVLFDGELEVDTVKSQNLTFNSAVSYSLSPEMEATIGIRHLFSNRNFRFGLSTNFTPITLSYAFSNHESLGVIHKLGVSIEH